MILQRIKCLLRIREEDITDWILDNIVRCKIHDLTCTHAEAFRSEPQVISWEQNVFVETFGPF